MFSIERWRTESRENPLERLPEHLSRDIIYGDPGECQEAYRELFAWSRSTGTQILDSELEYLGDARGQAGYDAARRQRNGAPSRFSLRRLIPKKSNQSEV